MPLRISEAGINRQVELYPGNESIPGGWRGIYREGDDASIPDDSVWLAENVRLQGHRFVVRGGQVKVNSSVIAAIDGIFDAGDTGA